MRESEFLLRIRPYLYEKEGLVSSADEDCAVIAEGQAFRLYTVDALVEDIHFKWSYFTPYALGFKLAAVNLSDIAAMGGIPEWALLTLGFPEPPRGDFIEGFYRGLVEGLSRFGARLVGGDTVRSPVFWAALFLSGRTENPILRKGASPGDLIYVSRSLGASAAALRYFLSGEEPPEFLRKAHLFPEPEISLGRLLSEKALASAMMDVSDGLLLDLSKLCRTSEVGAEIEEVPVAPGATEEEALSGGEDYALIFTVPKEKERFLLESVDRPLYRLGKIISQKEKIYLYGRPVAPEGFDHFELG
ncbi:Thiamine-monophosphate kinase [Thermosulfurimonas dismutans]|uniref:Thiamine-monophosphate kinase n=1 Tax=Thermosulfurimonas dismutans TaxID=999894 RepID=A0A179D6P8_9BACT|nr:Thiamine-monophosphate kinase [Thermosulfurimonas dismutans]